MKSTISRRNLFAATGGAAATIACATAPGAANAAPPSAPRNGPTQVAGKQPVVEINTGKLRGFASNGINVFRGVPYGASTAGKNRFMPPQPLTPWAGVRDALIYGNKCPFAPSGVGSGADNNAPEDNFVLYRSYASTSPHEDCLRLNVWAPAGAGKRPVMVYMHGGGFFVGDGHGLLAYDGENMARRGDAVIVTHNHRLNVFGYLDMSSLGGRWANSSNVGMQDIVAVLKWVNANIAQFGGDPNNVTIFGQSGGGGKVTTLMAMPSAKGLFHKAIVQSGAGGGGGRGISPADAVKLREEVFAKWGLTDPDKLADLTQDQVCAAATAFRARWSPVTDGKVVASTPTQDPSTLAAGVPLLVGSNLNELTNSVDDPKALTYSEADLAAAATKKYGAAGAQIVAAYRASHPTVKPIEIWNAMEAYGMRQGSFSLADRKYAVDKKVWQYMFAWHSPVLEGRTNVYHSAEISFVFGNAGRCVQQTGGGPDAIRVGDQMSDAWTSFARKGDPNHAGIPTWPAFDAKHPVMVFDNTTAVQLDPEAAGRKLIAAVAPASAPRAG